MRANAWFVARGFGQHAGVDYFETHFPFPSVATIRLLAALAYEVALELPQFDAEQAFGQSELSEEVYMRLPKGRADVR